MLILTLFALFLFFTSTHAQYRHIRTEQSEGHTWTGNLQYDLSQNVSRDDGFDSSTTQRTAVYRKKYSPLKAGLFSAVIPGAGQFYTKSYWKSAAFFGAEVLMWVAYGIYEHKGDRQTSDFQAYADQHWSVIRYAYWIKDDPRYGSFYSIIDNGNKIVPGGQAADIDRPWEYVNWNNLNAVETLIIEDQNHLLGTTGFTHQLVSHGEQQYYEMIGKYPQFGGGWDDASTFQPGGFTSSDVTSGNVSTRFKAYSQMRGDANNFYNIASTVSYIIVANHILSALEAAWNASNINHRVQLQGHIQSRIIYGNIVEFVPTLHMKYEL